tara:strand:- start:1034 stop:1738 length:705 start_codon:yes stop_codon:yes gene_type:complete
MIPNKIISNVKTYMDQLENAGTNTNQKKTFFSHMFKFDDETKVELLNVTQYAGLSIIPIVLLNKLVRRVIPETDETKGSLEILLEMIAQIIVLFVGMFYIHRLVTFVPTYSEKPYEPFILTSIVLPFLIILMSLHTKLGEKSNILFERLMVAINGEKEDPEEKKEEKKTTAPSMPVPERLTKKNEPNEVNYNSMHGGPSNPMINASTPNSVHLPQETELMAANEALGGGFGSMF